MTYAQFLALFLCLPTLLLGVLLRRCLKPHYLRACAAVCLLAFLYTAPWDNHAAAAGLWTFDPGFAPPSHFVLHLPWEEYAFYFLQGILTCLLVILFSRRLRPSEGDGGL